MRFKLGGGLGLKDGSQIGVVSIVVNRVLRDDPSKGDMHNRQPVTPRRLWIALKDYDMYPVSPFKHVGRNLG